MFLCERTTFHPHLGAFVPFLVCKRDELFQCAFGGAEREQETRFPFFASGMTLSFVRPVSRDGALSSSSANSLLPVFPLSLFESSYGVQGPARARRGAFLLSGLR